MAKIFVAQAAGVNPYLSADGMLNFEAVSKLQEKVAALLKADSKTQELKVTSTFVMSRRAKPAKYSASSEKKGDLKYLTQRSIKLAERKRLRPESFARISILLQIIDGPKVTAAVQASFKAVRSAIVAHTKKITKVHDNVSKKKAVVRDEQNAAAEESFGMLKELLEKAGIRDTSIVESKSIMGKTLLVKVGPNNVVSVGKADMTRFRAAQKAAKEQE